MSRLETRSIRTRLVLRSALTAAAGVFVLAAADGARAATITVPNTGDAGAAGDALVAAVHSAAAGDEIVLSPGDYNVRSTLDLTTNLTISGPETAPGARIRGGSLTDASSITGRPDLVAVGSGISATLRHVALTGTSTDGTTVDVFGSLSLENSLVGGNAGLGIAAQPESSVSVANSTISDNGTGLVAYGSATVKLAGVTLAANRLGGIFNGFGGSVDIVDTIVAGNGKASSARVGDCQQPIGSDSAPGSATTSIDGDGTCNAPIHADPRLGSLADNGGPTLTMSLAAGSPAIDAGSSDCPATDQRGAPRVGRCDIGAFEYGSAAAGAQPTSGGSGSGNAPAGQSGGGSGAGSGGSGPANSGQAHATAKLVGSGAIRVRGRAAAFQFRVDASRRNGLIVFDDPARGIRLRATHLSAALFDVAGKSATLRGSAVLTSGRRLGFTIRVYGQSRGRLQIRLSNGYAGSGNVIRGSLSITG